jgi:hypothetical protein
MKLAIYAALAASVAAVPAAATTIDVSQNANLDNVSFYHTSQTFNLGASFASALLNVNSLVADDLAVVRINGVNIMGGGIFGPGDGNVFFSASGSSTPYHFDYGNGTVNASFSAPFVLGANTIELFYNNNNSGINGGNNGLTGGPGVLQFNANISVNGGVPEPAEWALMIGGFGLAGMAARRRRSAVRVTYA